MDVDVKQARLHLGNLLRRHWKGTHCRTYWGINGKNKSCSLPSRTWTVKVKKGRRPTLEKLVIVEIGGIAAERYFKAEDPTAHVDDIRSSNLRCACERTWIVEVIWIHCLVHTSKYRQWRCQLWQRETAGQDEVELSSKLTIWASGGMNIDVKQTRLRLGNLLR
jgi:hypothetical protein